VKLSEKPERHASERIRLASKASHAKQRGGILFLALDLLGAIAINLAQRYAKSWSASLMVQIKDSPDGRGLSGSPSKISDVPERPARSEIGAETTVAKKSHPRGILALFKNTASEWIEDKCPQLVLLC
jgi:hypothetical protein